MGETLAIFHLSGKILFCNDESKIRIKGFLITSQVWFKILTSMLSNPPDFRLCFLIRFPLEKWYQFLGDKKKTHFLVFGKQV